jgi:hypothetical protein
VKPDGKPDNKSFRLVYTIPGALADTYAAQGKNPVYGSDCGGRTAGAPRTLLAYRVRTRASKKKDSAGSNTVVATLYAVADKIPQ